ncbi:MAG TPA: hypothetical protein VGJ26_05035 [Pirellulales bacterium]|jgi:hypothetical protein
MSWVFAVCSVIGGTVLVCQFLMTLIGLGHAFGDVGGGHDVGHGMGHDGGHDAGHDANHESTDDQHSHGSSWLFGVLTFRTVVAALTFFGLAGLAAEASQLNAETTFLIALAAGTSALYGVHWIMQSLSRLRADGTARVERTVGRPGSVYLRIPGAMQGTGKVTVNLGDRTVEYQAVTAGGPLPTGASVVVTAVISSDVLEVKAVQPALEPTHV